MICDLRSLARALSGEISGRQVLAPGPGHGRFDRSLSIRFDPAALGLVCRHGSRAMNRTGASMHLGEHGSTRR
jgi:hypothetical protein